MAVIYISWDIGRMTTQKHINYVANYMNLNLIKNES